jgi:transcriptional regulator with XRE-family HTH domain
MGLADRIKIVRESLGMSQTAIAKAAESSLPSWQGYEAGKNVPGGKVLEALARLGFNINWILTGEGQMRLSGGGQSIIGSSNSNVIQIGGAVGGTVSQGNIKRSADDEELCELLEKYGTKSLKEDLRSRLLQIKMAIER